MYKSTSIIYTDLLSSSTLQHNCSLITRELVENVNKNGGIVKEIQISYSLHEKIKDKDDIVIFYPAILTTLDSNNGGYQMNYSIQYSSTNLYLVDFAKIESLTDWGKYLNIPNSSFDMAASDIISRPFAKWNF